MKEKQPQSEVKYLKEGYISLIEIIYLVVIFALFLIFNLATYYIFATVKYDEAFLTDPAVNLYLNKGFTSTIFEHQTRTEFWVGNAPLHPLILANWIKVFGFNILSVRALNFLEMMLAAIMIWLGTVRLNLVKSRWSRVTMIAVLLLLDGIFYSYRTGRYDTLNILLCAGAFLAYSIPLIWLRAVVFFGIGIFMPMAGINLGPYIPVLCGLLIVFLGRTFVKETISLMMGCGVGLFLMYLLYFSTESWTYFLISAMGTRHSITGKLAKAILQGDPKHLAEYREIFLVWFRDSSSPLLLAVAIGIAIYLYRKGVWQWRSRIGFAVISGSLIPLVIFLAGQYPIYYTWMALIPMLMGIFATIDVSKFNPSKGVHWFLLVGLGLTCLVGLPLRFSQSTENADGKIYKPVEVFVEQVIKPDDWIMAEIPSFYAVKKAQKKYPETVVFFPTYARGPSRFKSEIPQAERKRINMMMLNPKSFTDVLARVGGEWEATGEEFKSSFDEYNLKIYRRKKEL